MYYRLRLVLLKHWNIYESMFNSPIFALDLGFWKSNGQRQLDLLLAKIGISLKQSRQFFSTLPDTVKTRVSEQLLKYKLVEDTDSLFAPSFEREVVGTHRTRMSASDVVYIVTAILESLEGDSFWNAYMALSSEKKNVNILFSGIPKAIETQKDIVAQAAKLITEKGLVSIGSFRYAIIKESVLLQRFIHPLALTKLAHFIDDAVSKARDNRKPLLMCTLDETKGMYLVVAVANGPLSSSNKK